MLLPGPDLICAEPLALLQHISAKYRLRKKKSHYLSAGPLAGPVPYYDKSGLSYCIIMLNKRLSESVRKQLLGPKFTFFPGLCI